MKLKTDTEVMSLLAPSYNYLHTLLTEEQKTVILKMLYGAMMEYGYREQARGFSRGYSEGQEAAREL